MGLFTAAKATVWNSFFGEGRQILPNKASTLFWSSTQHPRRRIQRSEIQLKQKALDLLRALDCKSFGDLWANESSSSSSLPSEKDSFHSWK